MMESYSREINVQNVLEWLCNQLNKSVSMKVFLLNMHEAMGFIWSGQAYMWFNLLCIFIFFSTKTTGLAYHQAVNVEEAWVMAT